MRHSGHALVFIQLVVGDLPRFVFLSDTHGIDESFGLHGVAVTATDAADALARFTATNLLRLVLRRAALLHLRAQSREVLYLHGLLGVHGPVDFQKVIQGCANRCQFLCLPVDLIDRHAADVRDLFQKTGMQVPALVDFRKMCRVRLTLG